MNLNSLLLLLSFVGFGLFAQHVPVSFSKVEQINDEYSVGYNYYSEEFDLFGDPYLIDAFDTISINITTSTCSYSTVSPNGKFAYFESLDIGWVSRSEVDSFLHDKWYGAVVDLSTAKVVKHCTIDCGDFWDSNNLWMQDLQVVFNGNDTIPRSAETIYDRSDESLDVFWITYHENGCVQETGQTSDQFGCGMNTGTHNFYSDEGILRRSVSYENWLPSSADGCHEVIQEMVVVEFAPQNYVKSKKRFQSAYEGEEYKAGIWEEFDEHGELLSSEDYGVKYKK